MTLKTGAEHVGVRGKNLAISRIIRLLERALVLAGLAAVILPVPPASAQNGFFDMLCGRRTVPAGANAYADPSSQQWTPFSWRQQEAPREQSEPLETGVVFCVRLCDGRYFPLSGGDKEGREGTCNSLCPSAETEVVYGSAIDEATTDKGKPYSKLPNAFRYRNELVAGCTCNGKDPVGLAKVDIEKDTTLRSGDIVAGENGLVVASKSENRRDAALKFSPASEKIKQRYRHPPVVAKE